MEARGHARTRRLDRCLRGRVGTGAPRGHAGRDAATTAGDPSDWNALAVTTFGADPTKTPKETRCTWDRRRRGLRRRGRHRRPLPAVPLPRPRAARSFPPRRPRWPLAHKVLVTYSPYAKSALDAVYTTSLAQIPDGRGKTRGVAFGTLAADNLIRAAARTTDATPRCSLPGRRPRASGGRRRRPSSRWPCHGWAPSPRCWCAAVLSSANLAHRRQSTSAQYTRDFAEVKTLGSATSTARTAEQTSTALFFSGNAAVQLNVVLRDQ